MGTFLQLVFAFYATRFRLVTQSFFFRRGLGAFVWICQCTKLSTVVGWEPSWVCWIEFASTEDRKMVCHFKKVCNWPTFFLETINAQRYQNLIQQFVSLLECDERFIWFQQDGATANTATETMQLLCSFFGDKLISKGLWPPRRPDPTPPDFFLWGYIKLCFSTWGHIFRSLEDIDHRSDCQNWRC